VGELRVNFGSLADLESSIERQVDGLESLLADLDQQVSGVAQVWEGAASDGFQRAMSQWRSAAGDLRERLAFARRFVTTAHDNHAGAVRGNTAMWRV
jgi:WXG100 family type VII secretion target